MNRSKDLRENLHMQIPDKVPVFPLPNVLLFPEIELPLYVFEPRYRQMLADCAEGNKFMAVSLLRRGWEKKKEPIPSHDVVGVGYIRAIFENPDGTSHILLKGIGRAKIVRYTQWRPYRIAKIKLLPDKIENREELVRLATRLKKLLMQKIRFSSETPHGRLHLPLELRNPITLSHIASFFAEASPYLKQDLLETTNCNCRMRHLIDLLEDEICPPGTNN